MALPKTNSPKNPITRVDVVVTNFDHWHTGVSSSISYVLANASGDNIQAAVGWRLPRVSCYISRFAAYWLSLRRASNRPDERAKISKPRSASQDEQAKMSKSRNRDVIHSKV